MPEMPSSHNLERMHPKILHAYWDTWNTGTLVLKKDWTSTKLPSVYLDPHKKLIKLKQASQEEFALVSAYYCKDEYIHFVLNCQKHPEIDFKDQDFYVVGEFNGWGQSILDKNWEMQPKRIADTLCFVLKVPKELCVDEQPVRFKFASSKNIWLTVPWDAPNWVQDGSNNQNYEIQPYRTGLHRFYFEVPTRTENVGLDEMVWEHPHFVERTKISCSKLLLSLHTDKTMGAVVQNNTTTFTIFAPRAKKVTVYYYETLIDPKLQTLDLELKEDVYWEGRCAKNLHGYYYYYLVAGDNNDAFSSFDENFKIMDPYAMAVVGPEGPGIIVDASKILNDKIAFNPPAWHDLVIVETHVRDLIAKAPIILNDHEKLGFKGLEKWINTQGNYIKTLGVNAIELQPIQAFDAQKKEDYHWGYMPVNYFSPAPQYTHSNGPEQIRELQDLVQACHKQELAVILDVVYNHFGVPNHLMYLDKYHYFDVSQEGYFINFSGCGNDLRVNAPMTKKMIIDSLIHLVQVYDIDGFRFDLADLLGVGVLLDIEKQLKAIKPSIILIAEPWSFKGHIGYELKNTGYASWNDGYRNFMHEYILGNGNWEGIEYYLKGSMSHLARFPAQSINYASSHDDYCWLDAITENMHNNGLVPTFLDRRRTHLMLALLIHSIGIPMLAQGTDLMHTKQGTSNTYQRGDLNAIDYERGIKYSGTHEYAKRLIQLRLSETGKLLRLAHRPSQGYFEFFRSTTSSGVAVLYNADGSLGAQRLLFAINPHIWEIQIDLKGLQAMDFRQIGDHERILTSGINGATLNWSKEGILSLPAVTCGMWILR